MKIETERLLLYPISDKEMVQLVDNEQDADLKQAYSEMLQGCVSEPEKRIWHAVWFMELKSHPGTIRKASRESKLKQRRKTRLPNMF